jgi:hypothetical protein
MLRNLKSLSRMRSIALVLAVTLYGCWRSPFPPPSPVPLEDDRAVRLPRFYDRPTISVGERREYYYELDGELLRAVAIAATDFLPPHSDKRSCGNRLEAQRYLVSREGNIIFVYIYEDPEYCGGGYLSLDSGVKYAISADGRILRRIFDGQPEEPFEWLNPDGGPRGVPAKPGVIPGFEPIERVKPSPSAQQDGGSSASPSQPPEERDGGTPLEVQDGGADSPAPVPSSAPTSVPDGGAPSDGGAPGVP